MGGLTRLQDTVGVFYSSSLLGLGVSVLVRVCIYEYMWCIGGARGVMVIVAGNGHGDETDCISHSTNTLGKGMNPIIFPLAIGK